MASIQVHHEVTFHSVYEGMFKVFAQLRMIDVPITAVKDVPSLDMYMLRKNDHRPPLEMPEAFSMIRWDNGHNPDVSHMCFAQPVIVGTMRDDANGLLDLRTEFRQYVLDTHFGVGTTDRVDAVCSEKPLGRILYIKRECSESRCIGNGEEFQRYLRLLGAVGFNVTTVVLTPGISMREQIRLSTLADLIIGPHGSGLTHMMWLPVPCGTLVEICGIYKIMQFDKQYFSELMNFTRHSSHLSYDPPIGKRRTRRPPTKGSPIILDIPHFHGILTQFLNKQPWWDGFVGATAMKTFNVSADGSKLDG